MVPQRETEMPAARRWGNDCRSGKTKRLSTTSADPVLDPVLSYGDHVVSKALQSL